MDPDNTVKKQRDDQVLWEAIFLQNSLPDTPPLTRLHFPKTHLSTNEYLTHGLTTSLKPKIFTSRNLNKNCPIGLSAILKT